MQARCEAGGVARPCGAGRVPKPAESRGQAPMPRPQCRAHRAGTSTRCRAFLGRPSILEVFLSSLTVPFLFGAARGLAGDERLAGELDLLLAPDDDHPGDERCDLRLRPGGYKPGEQAETALNPLYSATNHTH